MIFYDGEFSKYSHVIVLPSLRVIITTLDEEPIFETFQSKMKNQTCNRKKWRNSYSKPQAIRPQKRPNDSYQPLTIQDCQLLQNDVEGNAVFSTNIRLEKEAVHRRYKMEHQNCVGACVDVLIIIYTHG